jgi:hypothetical protein
MPPLRIKRELDFGAVRAVFDPPTRSAAVLKEPTKLAQLKFYGGSNDQT